MAASRREARLHASGPAESDGDLAAFYDHRDFTASARVLEHLGERLCIPLDIMVANDDVSRCVILTGR
jgi:hypothetical protein